MNDKFELIVRAFIVRNGKVLLCQTHGRDYYFLPGGHVEFGENMRDALKRELYEELEAKIEKAEYIGLVENLFVEDGVKKHEINVVFHAEIDVQEVVAKEDHLTFHWMTIEEFIEKNIMPSAMKDAITRWTANKETFFVETID